MDRALHPATSQVTRRQTSEIIRNLPGWVKAVISIGALLTTLYGAVRFVADTEYNRFEQVQRKIGREEFEKRMGDVNKKLDDLDKRLDAVERGR